MQLILIRNTNSLLALRNGVGWFGYASISIFGVGWIINTHTIRIIISFFDEVLLNPLFLQLQVARQFVIWVSSGLFAYFLLALLHFVNFFLLCVEMGAQIEVINHAEVFEIVLPDFIIGLVGPGKDVIVLILCILFVESLHPLFPYGPFNFCFGFFKSKIGEFLINKYASWILFDQTSKRPAVHNAIVLIQPLDFDLLVFLVLDHFVLSTVL